MKKVQKYIFWCRFLVSQTNFSKTDQKQTNFGKKSVNRPESWKTDRVRNTAIRALIPSINANFRINYIPFRRITQLTQSRTPRRRQEKLRRFSRVQKLTWSCPRIIGRLEKRSSGWLWLAVWDVRRSLMLRFRTSQIGDEFETARRKEEDHVYCSRTICMSYCCLSCGNKSVAW